MADFPAPFKDLDTATDKILMVQAKERAEKGLVDSTQELCQLGIVNDVLLISVITNRVLRTLSPNKGQDLIGTPNVHPYAQLRIGMNEVILAARRDTVQGMSKCAQSGSLTGLIGAVDNMKPLGA